MWTSIKKGLWGYIFVAPQLILILAFMIIPILTGITMGFKEYHFFASKWIGLANYQKILHSEIFWKALRVTTLYTILSISFGMTISLLLAEFISSLESRKLQTFFKGSFYLPCVCSMIVVSIIWIWLYHPTIGLINHLLSKVGLGPFLWLSSSKTALISLIMMGLFTGLGPTIIILVAGRQAIPKTYYEAARLDGATKRTLFFKITLPLLKPVILFILVISTIWSYQVFQQIYVMTEGGPSYSTTTLVYLIYAEAFSYFRFGKASAIALILGIIIFAMTIIQYRYLKGRVEYV